MGRIVAARDAEAANLWQPKRMSSTEADALYQCGPGKVQLAHGVMEGQSRHRLPARGA
jgi:hypothetical protein